MTIFEGTFNPPIIGSREAPIKIAGSGFCDVTFDGLRIQGFKQTPIINSSQFVILFLIVLFGVAIIKALWSAMPAWLVNTLITAPFTMAIPHFLKGQGTDHQGESIELLIPWDKISSARLDKVSGDLIIHIKKFRHQDERYEGALFFNPSDGSDSLLNALQEHKAQMSN